MTSASRECSRRLYSSFVRSSFFAGGLTWKQGEAEGAVIPTGTKPRGVARCSGR